MRRPRNQETDTPLPPCPAGWFHGFRRFKPVKLGRGNGSKPSRVSWLLWESRSGIRSGMRVTSLRGITSGGSFCGPAGGAGAEERLRGRIRNRVCTWSRHLRRRAGCVGFWVMITHRNAGHVRRRLAECCDFLPGWWTAPKPAGPQTRLKRTQNAALPPTRECKSAHFPFARAASPTKGGEGGAAHEVQAVNNTTPPPS